MDLLYGSVCWWVFYHCEKIDIKVFQKWDEIPFGFWTVIRDYFMRSWVAGQSFVVKQLSYSVSCLIDVTCVAYLYFLRSRNKGLLPFLTNQLRDQWGSYRLSANQPIWFSPLIDSVCILLYMDLSGLYAPYYTVSFQFQLCSWAAAECSTGSASFGFDVIYNACKYDFLGM